MGRDRSLDGALEAYFDLLDALTEVAETPEQAGQVLALRRGMEHALRDVDAYLRCGRRLAGRGRRQDATDPRASQTYLLQEHVPREVKKMEKEVGRGEPR